MKEVGIDLTMRILAKAMRPRLIITENDGKWTMRTESLLMTAFVEFVPDVEFDDKTADGREIKVEQIINTFDFSSILSTRFFQLIF
jgi:predicted RNA-binding protein with TRAM domain